MLSGSSIRYLLAIYQLSDGGAAVRSVDLANLLGITRASVVKNLKKLTDNGLVCKKHYGSIRLTAPGIQETNRVLQNTRCYPAILPFVWAFRRSSPAGTHLLWSVPFQKKGVKQ